MLCARSNTIYLAALSPLPLPPPGDSMQTISYVIANALQCCYDDLICHVHNRLARLRRLCFPSVATRFLSYPPPSHSTCVSDAGGHQMYAFEGPSTYVVATHCDISLRLSSLYLPLGKAQVGCLCFSSLHNVVFACFREEVFHTSICPFVGA